MYPTIFEYGCQPGNPFSGLVFQPSHPAPPPDAYLGNFSFECKPRVKLQKKGIDTCFYNWVGDSDPLGEIVVGGFYNWVSDSDPFDEIVVGSFNFKDCLFHKVIG